MPGSKTQIEGKQGKKTALGLRHLTVLLPIVPLRLTLFRPGVYKLDMASETELSGKVVVVTGASMGIGEAIAKVFADHGACVAILSRDAARAEAARDRVGHLRAHAGALACDVRHREQIDQVIALAMSRFGRIDVWVNNAGHGIVDSVAQVDMSLARETFDTNFFGALAAMQAVIPIMRQQGCGAIIKISSVAGHIPVSFPPLSTAPQNLH